jgi:hypothetical protein
MTQPIDPIRRSPSDADVETPNLPAVIEGEEAASPPPPVSEAPAAFFAQLLGQSGQKRGLRGGAPVIEAAREAYVRTEWSGRIDRRTPRGGTTKREI